jgi:antitoxin component YwqK of YwqJK toxin-antitoxin module
MNQLITLLLVFFACSCKGKEQQTSTDKVDRTVYSYIQKTSANLSVNNDVVFVDGKRYSGFIYELDKDKKDTISIDEYNNGLLNGTSKKWYPNKQLMEERFYSKGRKNGKHVSYWQNGNKRFEFFAKDDAYEGELKEWSVDGNLIHLANFKNGQEEGVQKLWYENGKIRANYVMLQGKRYGLLGTKNCRNVSDSIFLTQ